MRPDTGGPGGVSVEGGSTPVIHPLAENGTRGKRCDVSPVFAMRWIDLPEWITTQEAAEQSGYAIEYLQRLARNGKIGAEKKGRDWWIDRDVFRNYIETMLSSEDGRAGPRTPPAQTAH